MKYTYKQLIKRTDEQIQDQKKKLLIEALEDHPQLACFSVDFRIEDVPDDKIFRDMDQSARVYPHENEFGDKTLLTYYTIWDEVKGDIRYNSAAAYLEAYKERFSVAVLDIYEVEYVRPPHRIMRLADVEPPIFH